MPIGDRQARWLAAFSWKDVTKLNAEICEATRSFHGPTSDGHDHCRDEWSGIHTNEMSFKEALAILKGCHRQAPFCFNNGNTFAAIGRTCVILLTADPDEAKLLRSAAGHFVAGVLREDELDAILADFD